MLRSPNEFPAGSHLHDPVHAPHDLVVENQAGRQGRAIPLECGARAVSASGMAARRRSRAGRVARPAAERPPQLRDAVPARCARGAMTSAATRRSGAGTTSRRGSVSISMVSFGGRAGSGSRSRPRARSAAGCGSRVPTGCARSGRARRRISADDARRGRRRPGGRSIPTARYSNNGSPEMQHGAACRPHARPRGAARIPRPRDRGRTRARGPDGDPRPLARPSPRDEFLTESAPALATLAPGAATWIASAACSCAASACSTASHSHVTEFLRHRVRRGDPRRAVRFVPPPGASVGDVRDRFNPLRQMPLTRPPARRRSASSSSTPCRPTGRCGCT